MKFYTILFFSHPLQALTVPLYVANDCYLVGGDGGGDDVGMPEPQYKSPGTSAVAPSSTWAPESPSMLIMTGPNYSGKSVYLKQVIKASNHAKNPRLMTLRML